MADINRIIKEARNTLVGKVPDPQSQIDQITLALIYKFMDAKDKEAVALGLQPQFFVGEYADYSFSNIMSAPSNPKQFELYTKGIDLLQKRIDLPETFVSVFKDAFVPYRDAQTLHLFLNEINKIPTDNTELLGTAFEDLLSIMGSQGDAGQFRTPRHIIDMIVEIVEPKTGESILDPACGTAGFLISAYNKISKQDLTIEERDNLINEGLVGYDINPNMVKLASVNLFLHGCKKPNIHLYDTLTEKDFWKDNYDVILANPPFMTPKGGIRPHELFSAINANRSEVLFTYYIAKHLRRDGRAGIIVPEGVVFQSANAYKNLRKMLVEENYLYAVISLPAGVFNPYSGVKTSVLLFDKALARKTDKMLFVKMNNDGFDLGAQRRPIDKNDIPVIVDTVKRFISCVSTETESDFVDENGVSSIVSKSRIAENDYILVGDRYAISDKFNAIYPTVKLGEISTLITKGTTPTTLGFDFVREGIRFIKIENIGINNKLAQGEYNYITHECDNALKRSQLEENDILFSIAGALGRTAIVNKEFLPANTNQALAIIRLKDKRLVKYVWWLLSNDIIKAKLSKLKAGVAQFNLSLQQISNIEIPIPPIEIQEQIVAELDSYQKIVDGARQIVENYKPTINVDPNWDVVRIEDICEINKKTVEPESDFIYLDIASVENGTGKISYNQLLKASEAPSRARRKVENNSILLSTVRPNLKAFGYVEYKCPEKCVASTGFAVLDAKHDNAKFIYYSLFQNYVMNQMIASMGKGAYPSINQNEVAHLQIKLPSLEIQQQIVENINEEMTIIEQNKRLIEIFEQKINVKINEVWGSEIK